VVNVAVSELYPTNPVVHEVLIVFEVERRHQGDFTSALLDDLLFLPTFIELLHIGSFLLFVCWVQQNAVFTEG
jgi:hypothetical protein